MYIDTLPGGILTIGPPLWGKIFIKEIRWENYAAADILTIAQIGAPAGSFLIEEQPLGDTNFQVMRFGPFGWVNGIVITSIGAGNGGASPVPNLSITVTKS